MNKRGFEVTGVMIAIVVMLLVLSLVLLFNRKILDTGSQVAGIAGCSAASIAGSNGRCFATNDCDGKVDIGMVPTEGQWGCPDELPNCCYLPKSNENLYYPVGTVLIDVLGKPSAQFRYVEGKLAFESGEKGTEKWLVEGIPRRRQLQISYKAETGSSACKLVFTRCDTGEWCMKVREGIECAQSGFTVFRDDRFTLSNVDNAAAAATCGTLYPKAHTCLTGTIEFARPPEDTSGSKSATFTIPFASS